MNAVAVRVAVSMAFALAFLTALVLEIAPADWRALGRRVLAHPLLARLSLGHTDTNLGPTLVQPFPVAPESARLRRSSHVTELPLDHKQKTTITAPRCCCFDRFLYPVVYAGEPAQPYLILHRYCSNCAREIHATDFTRGLDAPVRLEWKKLADLWEMVGHDRPFSKLEPN
jgi:hypothetical protein